MTVNQHGNWCWTLNAKTESVESHCQLSCLYSSRRRYDSFQGLERCAVQTNKYKLLATFRLLPLQGCLFITSNIQINKNHFTYVNCSYLIKGTVHGGWQRRHVISSFCAKIKWVTKHIFDTKNVKQKVEFKKINRPVHVTDDLETEHQLLSSQFPQRKPAYVQLDSSGHHQQIGNCWKMLQ